MSKVIFKISFKHPNKKDTTKKNISHINYIATRPGTDKTVTESDLRKELEKGTSQISRDNSDNETYVKYIDERPKSHGLFGQDGIEDPKLVQSEISQVESFVWRAIVSIREEDAKEINYLEKDKWQDMLRKKVPDMAAEMDIPFSNLRWVGSVHMEKGHPHAHIVFWENIPQRTVGVVNTKTIDNIRKMFADEIFEEERFQLMNEKNIMRDLIRDLAHDDVSKATQLLKDLRAAGQELKTFISGMNQEGIAPRLYNEKEQKIAEMIEALSKKLPAKGRIALKFMPEDIKEEVRAIADYMLTQPEFAASLAKNLKAVEELTKMYTGKEDAIQVTRDNAYRDIRDRICQVILKGAVESQKDNIFYVDQELSQKAVDFIKNMNNQINLIPEQIKVLNLVTIALTRTGHNDGDTLKILSEFARKENIHYSDESIKNIIKQIRGGESEGKNINSLSSPKKVDYYLSILKLAGATETEAFTHINDIIKNDSQELERQLNTLKEDGILKKQGEHYKLTNRGIEEFLNVKELDKAEKEILKMLESDKSVSFKELLDNKSIFINLYNKDPEELKISKFDAKIREEFGEDNRITLRQLESRIYEKYTDDELNVNVEKAGQEFDILKKRIEKLTLNGYIELDKATGIYSFAEESQRYFEYDDEKETYVLTNEAIEKFNISKEMEFTRYDANVTLSYIDKSEGGILTADQFKEALKQEITNQTAQEYYAKFTELIDTDLFEKAKAYISIDQEGNLRSTEVGNSLGISLNKLNKYFRRAKGELTDERLKEICSTDQEYQSVLNQVEKHVKNGHIEKDQNTGIYRINPIINDINNLLYQIYKEGGSINKENLKGILEKNIPNYEAEKQFKYLIWRLDNLKDQGYLKGQEKEYQLTLKGIEKRADILIPERDLLRGTLGYLERLGLIAHTEEGYMATEKYYRYMKDIAVSKEKNIARTSDYISKDLYELIDRTQDNINVGKIERTNERIATGKYINDEYQEIKTGYEDIRSACGVSDTIEKAINKLSITLLVSGVNLVDTKEIINKWNERSNSNIDPEKLNDIIDKAYKTVAENNAWRRITIISTKEWREMFEAFGIKDENMPKWIYKGENWQSFHHNMGLTIINDIWKSIWSTLEKQRLQAEAQASFEKRFAKLTTSLSKEAIKELIRKNKDNTLVQDDEIEIG